MWAYKQALRTRDNDHTFKEFWEVMTTKIDQLITSQNSQLTVTVARKLVEYTVYYQTWSIPPI